MLNEFQSNTMHFLLARYKKSGPIDRWINPIVNLICLTATLLALSGCALINPSHPKLENVDVPVNWSAKDAAVPSGSTIGGKDSMILC
jgi:hypothetical protein